MPSTKTIVLKSSYLSVASVISTAQWASEKDFKKAAKKLCRLHNVAGKTHTTVICDEYIYHASRDLVEYRYD